MKTCSRCKEAKPILAFPIRRASHDGLAPLCKLCKNLTHRLRYATDEAYERIKRRAVERTRAHPEKRREWERHRRQTVPGYANALRVWKTLKTACRVPPWVKRADFLPIYAERAALGPEYEVDHIIPLNGKLVSGLYVPENLQILTREQNYGEGEQLRDRGLVRGYDVFRHDLQHVAESVAHDVRVCGEAVLAAFETVP